MMKIQLGYADLAVETMLIGERINKTAVNPIDKISIEKKDILKERIF